MFCIILYMIYHVYIAFSHATTLDVMRTMVLADLGFKLHQDLCKGVGSIKAITVDTIDAWLKELICATPEFFLTFLKEWHVAPSNYSHHFLNINISMTRKLEFRSSSVSCSSCCSHYILCKTFFHPCQAFRPVFETSRSVQSSEVLPWWTC